MHTRPRTRQPHTMPHDRKFEYACDTTYVRQHVRHYIQWDVRLGYTNPWCSMLCYNIPDHTIRDYDILHNTTPYETILYRYHRILHHIAICYVMLYHTQRCHGILYCASYTMIWHAVIRYATLCHTILNYIMIYEQLRYVRCVVIWHNAVSWYVSTRHTAVWYNVILCCTMLWYVMSCTHKPKSHAMPSEPHCT